MEHFYTIQGEGYHQGKAAYFIRLAGCDVGCHWCDVKDSWTVEAAQIILIDALIEELNTLPKGICVITGGEPAMYDLTYLCHAIHTAGWKAHIETSGAYPIKGSLDWICVSPKKFKAPIEPALQMADELKVIVFNESDFDWGKKYAEKVSPECRLYLQPEWSKEKLVLPLMVNYVKDHPEWNVSIQTHKYMGID
ncbi:MAG: radical SAM protein [Bacteroidetes bacterium]|nr:radical SAM protein [Bacteroidota bacterium]